MRKIFTLIVMIAFALSMQASIYIVGNAPFGNWDPTAGVEMTQNTDGTFRYTATISGSVWFVFASGLDASWDVFNSEYRYGPASGADEEVQAGAWITTQKQGNGNGAYKFVGSGSEYTISFNPFTMKFKIHVGNVELSDGVYQDGSTLYITSGVTSLGPLQVNPSVIYSFAPLPPTCVENTFLGYGATLHMPAASYGAYFTADYWCNFANMYNDAVEPTGVTISNTEAQVEIGKQLTLTAIVSPSNATPSTVRWSTTDAAVATVSNGVVTAKGVGECDIVATCINKQAVCHVKVVETTIVISLDKHEARLLPNHSVTITPTMSPITTTLKVTVSNPEVAAARLMNGVVQVVGLAEGTTMIVVSSVDGQAVPDACTVTVYTELGDVNGDGSVNISDVTALIDYLLSGNPSGVNLTAADCNQDSSVNISDVTSLIDYLLSGTWN